MYRANVFENAMKPVGFFGVFVFQNIIGEKSRTVSSRFLTLGHLWF
jgi:hypothetical protein